MPETALQGLAGVSLTGKTLGPRKASQHSLGIFSPASCYVIQKTCGFPPGNPQALSVCIWLGRSSLPGSPCSLPGLMTWLILFAEPHMGSCNLALFFLGATLAGSPPNHTCSNYGSKGDEVMLVGCH